MPTLQRPGVYVEESASPSFVAATPGASVAAFIGPNGRGPIVPTLVQSWTEFVRIFGGFENPIVNNYLPYSVYNFFSNGGRSAYISRAVGTGALASTRSLVDRQGTPVATLKVDAYDPGAWGDQVFIEITDGTATTLFNLTVYSGGATASRIVERWTDLSMDPTSPQYAPSRLGSATSGSKIVKVTDLAPTSVVAYTSRRPALQAPTALATGANGAAPNTTQVQAAISALDTVTAPLLINLPGDQANVASAITYAEARGDCFVVIDPAIGIDPAAAVAFSASLTASSFGAIFYPWVVASDPSSTASGGTRTVPPGGFVLGKIADTDASRGVFKAPAGLTTRLSSAVALERKLTNTELDTLNTNKVNVIRQVVGAGIVIMGSRTLSNVLNTQYISVRRTLIAVRTAAQQLTQFVPFEPNDSFLWGSVSSTLQQYLLGFWQSGGLAGNSADQAFYVKCDEDNNTPTSVQNGVVNIEIGVAPQYPAEFVVIRIGQWSGGRTTIESV